MRILLAARDEYLQKRLAAVFSAQNEIEIVGMVGTVEEAVLAARHTAPEIVLMHMDLAGGSGIAAARRILAGQPGCKVILLSQTEETSELLDAILAGVRGYLPEEIYPSRLVAAVRSVQQGESAITRSMTLRLMEAYKKSLLSRRPANPKVKLLTVRETDVLAKLAVGKTNQEIALEFHISENTVKNHVQAILHKLGVPDRRAAAGIALDNGVLENTATLRLM